MDAVILGFTTDKQDIDEARHISRLAAVSQTLDVIVAGNRAGVWTRHLQGMTPAPRCWAVGTQPRRGEAAIALGLELLEIALSGGAPPGARYVIAGRPAALGLIAERLRALGRDAHWVPMLSAEIVSELNPEVAQAHDRFRDLVMEQIRRREGFSTPKVQEVADQVMRHWPEMRDADERKRLFGYRQMRRICEVVGMRVVGLRVLPPETDDFG
jgi:hypothetical protein